MGKGIIDYLVRANMDAALLVTGLICGHSRDRVVPGRAAKNIFMGHRTHRWYPVPVVCDEYGSEAPQF